MIGVAAAIVVESDSVCVSPDEGGWAPGDSCMSALLRFTESGWLTGTRVVVDRLGKLPPKQLKELRKEAAKKGVWLEYQTKGKLADATRTYWLVGVEELDTLLPASQEEERTEEEAGEAARAKAESPSSKMTGQTKQWHGRSCTVPGGVVVIVLVCADQGVATGIVKGKS